MKGTIFDIKEMAVHDGPGLRTTVFLKGCPLRCIWCHNPEGLSFQPQLLYHESRCTHCGSCRIPCSHEECRPFHRCIHVCPQNCLEISGRSLSAEELAAELRPGAEVLGSMFGGFTFSGGEPLAQPDFLLELIGLLSEYPLCIETSGYAEPELFEQVITGLDYVIMDIKLADCEKHLQYTGVKNDRIIRNFRLLQKSGKPHLIRTPLIPGITDTAENLAAVRELLGDSPWEQLPYNEMAGAKYPLLGLAYPYQKGEESKI